MKLKVDKLWGKGIMNTLPEKKKTKKKQLAVVFFFIVLSYTHVVKALER